VFQGRVGWWLAHVGAPETEAKQCESTEHNPEALAAASVCLRQECQPQKQRSARQEARDHKEDWQTPLIPGWNAPRPEQHAALTDQQCQGCQRGTGVEQRVRP
jgi:hypothetical protein